MIKSEVKIRPAGRHILTIGKDLIQDHYAAIVELVKNSYDADATKVNITFDRCSDETIQIPVADNGHGMSANIITDKWMVPSTDYKKEKKTSPLGRIMQGQKGIGRYAVSVLGNIFLLETVHKNTKTSLDIDWNIFEKTKYLDDIRIPIKIYSTNEPQGTKLTITGGKEYLNLWYSGDKNNKAGISDFPAFEKLISELRKLKSPLEDISIKKDNFDIFIQINNFTLYPINIKIEPYPLFKFYDYRIYGTVSYDGKGNLHYSSQKAINIPEESIPFDLKKETKCGNITFDIRVFDRESASIDSLIKRGLKKENGDYLSKLEAKELLNKFNGIGVYRNGFRIRPLGDSDFDWLKLNEARIQKPTRKISFNQVIGIVQVEDEINSHLIEKSARDGLIENEAYSQLILLTTKVIEELEIRRYIYRKKAGLSRPSIKIESEFEKLFSFDSLKRDIQSTLDKYHIDSSVATKVLEYIEKSEQEKNKTLQGIREIFAVYQGQATLGKIINIVLHEGRKPLSFFKNHIPILEFYYKKYLNGNIDDLPTLTTIYDELKDELKDFSINSNILVSLFSKIDPLATGNRGKKKKLILKSEIEKSWKIFSDSNSDVVFNVKDDKNVPSAIYGWRQDIYAIFTNLIENSIYWMNEKVVPKKKIDIALHSNNGDITYIDYKDSGPGIDQSLIESEIIFEPDFSTKPDGTGIGLSIAGEAARRMGLELKAINCNEGAYFRLEKKEEEK